MKTTKTVRTVVRKLSTVKVKADLKYTKEGIKNWFTKYFGKLSNFSLEVQKDYSDIQIRCSFGYILKGESETFEFNGIIAEIGDSVESCCGVCDIKGFLQITYLMTFLLQ